MELHLAVYTTAEHTMSSQGFVNFVYYGSLCKCSPDQSFWPFKVDDCCSEVAVKEGSTVVGYTCSYQLTGMCCTKVDSIIQCIIIHTC